MNCYWSWNKSGLDHAVFYHWQTSMALSRLLSYIIYFVKDHLHLFFLFELLDLFWLPKDLTIDMAI